MQNNIVNIHSFGIEIAYSMNCIKQVFAKIKV